MIGVDKKRKRIILIPADLEREKIEIGEGEDLVVRIVRNPRLDLEVVMAGRNSNLQILGTFLGKNSDSQSVVLRVLQQAPNTTCNVRFRSVLQDSAASFFDGLVRMEKGAENAHGFLSYRALLLSNKARAKPIPRLEVLTKKVAAAGHESAIGKISEEQLFYLQSRGFSQTEAENLIMDGFLKHEIK